MKLSSFIKTLGLGLALFAFPPVAAAKGKSKLIQVHVLVYDYAPISAPSVEKAEDQASRVLRDAGVELIWANCLPQTPRAGSFDPCGAAGFSLHLDVRIVRSSRNLKASTVGISFFAEDGQGCCADLFYEPIQQLQEESDAPLSVILGYAMAHELGHLLLGIHAHTPNGIMRAHWTRQDLQNASRGNLWFSTEQSLRIRSRLAPPERPAMRTQEISPEIAAAETLN